jgi:hypothetical protein
MVLTIVEPALGRKRRDISKTCSQAVLVSPYLYLPHARRIDQHTARFQQA